MWDLARWGRFDTQNGDPTSLPLSEERLKWWLRRATLVVEKAKETWPQATVWMRTLHRVGFETMQGASCQFLQSRWPFFDGADHPLRRLPTWSEVRARSAAELLHRHVSVRFDLIRALFVCFFG